MRTIFDIPDSLIKKLDKIARKKNVSRTELARRAISLYIKDLENIPSFDDIYGLWEGRKDIGDGVEYQRKLRAEWDRE